MTMCLDAKRFVCSAVCATIAALLLAGGFIRQFAMGAAMDMTTLGLSVAMYFVGFLFLGCAKMCMFHGKTEPKKKR